jgi:hypothetical protein
MYLPSSFALTLACILSTTASAMMPVAESRFSFLSMTLYDARLYTLDGRWRPGQYPLRLDLTYARDISARQLVIATEREWERMGIRTRSGWLAHLSNIWPSVQRGDRLAYRVDARGTGRFYFNGQPIGRAMDKSFSDAFLAIWLSPDARDQKLRRLALEGGT